LATDTVPDAVSFPATALTGQANVWVLDEGVLAARRVTVLGEKDDGASVIVAPFDMADGVVAIPPLEAFEGQAVSARQTANLVASSGGRVDAAE